MSRTLNDLIVKVLHYEPYLINSVIDLHRKVQVEAGHKINFKHFVKRVQENFK